MNSCEIFCNNLRKTMIYKNLNFAQLYELTNKTIPPTYNTKILNPETFNPTIQTMEKIAKALEVPLHQLLDPEYIVVQTQPLPRGYHIVKALLTDYETIDVREKDKKNKRRLKLDI